MGDFYEVFYEDARRAAKLRVLGEFLRHGGWLEPDEDDEEDELALVYYRCQTQDDIFLSSSLTTGIIRYQHDLVSTDRLHPMRFYHQLENRGYYPQLRLDGDEHGLQTEGAVAKYLGTEAGNKAAEDAIQALGGNGYINEYATGRLLRDAKLYEIGAGTSEIRRMLIGRELFDATG